MSTTHCSGSDHPQQHQGGGPDRLDLQTAAGLPGERGEEPGQSAGDQADQGETEPDGDEADRRRLAALLVGQQDRDQQGRPQLDRRTQAGEGTGHPGSGARRQQCPAGQHRRDQVEADVAQRPDQEHEQQPEVDTGVMSAPSGPPDRVREQAVEREHEHDERHQVRRAVAEAHAVGEREDPDHGRRVLHQRAWQADGEQPRDLAVVVVHVAHDERLESGEDAEHQQPGHEPGEDDGLPAAAGVPPADQTGSGGRRGCGERAGHPGRLAVEWLAG